MHMSYRYAITDGAIKMGNVRGLIILMIESGLLIAGLKHGSLIPHPIVIIIKVISSIFQCSVLDNANHRFDEST